LIKKTKMSIKLKERQNFDVYAAIEVHSGPIYKNHKKKQQIVVIIKEILIKSNL
jgi:hypothetical protein